MSSLNFRINALDGVDHVSTSFIYTLGGGDHVSLSLILGFRELRGGGAHHHSLGSIGLNGDMAHYSLGVNGQHRFEW